MLGMGIFKWYFGQIWYNSPERAQHCVNKPGRRIMDEEQKARLLGVLKQIENELANTDPEKAKTNALNVISRIRHNLRSVE